jgi:mannose-binding lectin 2
VQFKGHGKGKDLYRDGLAIWYAKDRMVPGPVVGNMDYFQIIIITCTHPGV